MRTSSTRPPLAVTWVCALGLIASSPAAAQPLFKLGAPDGTAVASFGLLSQPTVEWDQVDGTDGSASVYARRLRLIGGGNIGKVKFFLDSDTPNLGREMAGVRQHTTYLQDLIVTYAHRPGFQVDAGLLMVPVSYNSVQSAGSLLAIGYGSYSFVSSAPTTSKVGRDQGVQARGYLLGQHLEYRAGVFRGIRQIQPDAPLRTTVRVAWHAFDPQTGFFYTGTTLGKKRLLSIGASFDRQDDHSSKAVDFFCELPVNGRDAVTLQADLIRYDGGRTLRQIPLQDTLFVESGYTWGRLDLGVYGQAAWLRSDVSADSGSWQVGAAWWMRGHRANLKAGIGRVTRQSAPTRTQLLLQTQVFVF